MAAFRYIVPALAVARGAVAQSSCSASETMTIQNQADASGLSSCSTYSGSIAIATGTGGEINIPGVQRITGSLSATNVSQLTGLSADSLEIIDDSFTLNECQILSTLNFPRLTQVTEVDWNALAGLQGLSFTTGLQEVDSLMIQNTQLGTLDGINLQTAATVTIVNNNYLNDITMQLGNISESITLEANGMNVSANFPNLEWAANVTMRNVSSLNVPSLASVNGSMGLYANFFEAFSAANLTTVGGTLSFVSNEDLTNISMPELTTVNGGLPIQNNTQLEVVHLPSLETVGGALDFYGNFTNVTIPELNVVRGAFNLQSSEDLGNTCERFSSLNQVIRGEFSCKGREENPQGQGSLADGTSDSGSGGSSTSSSDSSDSTSSGSAASTVYISGATGFMGVVAAIFGLL